MTSDSSASQSLFESENSDPSEALPCNGLNLLPWQSSSSGVSTPDFTNARQPKYLMGSRCRWIPTPQTDWGTVIGQVYAPDLNNPGETSQWSWLYLLLLDTDSPSQRWVGADWVSEEDLEFLPAGYPQSGSRDGQEVL